MFNIIISNKNLFPIIYYDNIQNISLKSLKKKKTLIVIDEKSLRHLLYQEI
jgi:hypothetical protein